MNRLDLLSQSCAAPAAGTAASPLARWGEEVKRILCVRTDDLDDVLMTTPALHALRAAVPGRQLTLLTSHAAAALAPLLEDVDDVIRYAAPWAGPRMPRTHPADLAMRARLEEGRFDAAVIFTAHGQNPLPAATLCYLAGIRRRLARCRENPYALLSDWVRDTGRETGTQHEVERQLSLVSAVGALANDTRMRLRVRDLDRKTLAATLARRRIDANIPYLVVHPGASAESRRYRAERFGVAAAQLVRATGMNVLVTGSANDAPLARTLLDAAGASVAPFLHDLTDALELGGLAALIERASVLVSNFSAAVHFASALGTPVVDLYALAGLRGIASGEVASATLELIEQRSSAPRAAQAAAAPAAAEQR